MLRPHLTSNLCASTLRQLSWHLHAKNELRLTESGQFVDGAFVGVLYRGFLTTFFRDVWLIHVSGHGHRPIPHIWYYCAKNGTLDSGNDLARREPASPGRRCISMEYTKYRCTPAPQCFGPQSFGESEAWPLVGSSTAAQHLHLQFSELILKTFD